MTKTIMLIHGAWLNSASWAGFKARYEARGYSVLAPDWPHDNRTPAELRAAPRPELAKVGQSDIIASYERKIRALPEAPILIGHSLGGVFVQYLLDHGYGAAGVAIDPAPIPGIPLGPQAIISALPVFSDLGSGSKVKVMSRKFFRTRFAQLVPDEIADHEYDRYIVPTPGKVYWDGISAAAGRINWANPDRAPLLFIAGGKDLIADAGMTKTNHQRQLKAGSATEFKLFENRCHWTCLEPGWQEVADYALDWAISQAASRPVVLPSARGPRAA